MIVKTEKVWITEDVCKFFIDFICDLNKNDHLEFDIQHIIDDEYIVVYDSINKDNIYDIIFDKYLNEYLWNNNGICVYEI